MNPYNLIDPYSPQEQMSWHRWYKGSLLVVAIVVMILSGLTAQRCLDIYRLKKKLAQFHTTGALAALENYQRLCAHYATLKQQIELIKSWQQSSWYYKHLVVISEKIPACVMLELLTCDKEDVTLEGQAQSIETLLGFIHDLNTTELFQSMNLIELKPSTLFYDEKKLVNFIIKGKLKGL